VTLLFATTAFVSAALLFWVQPMIARMILPSLGGTPAVWNTCLVFFQATLLAGYTYAHVSVRWLGVRTQAWLHLVVVLLPFAVLPLSVRASDPPAADSPVGWLLLALACSVGLPFFVLAATAPLLHRWFADIGRPAGQSPYALYAASNMGSLLALLAYPALIEPSLNLSGPITRMSQVNAWAIGYALFCALLVACHVVRAKVRPDPSCQRAPATRPSDGPPPTLAHRLRWVALAFVPSSLMMGVTTYITLDIVAIPLLWVIPLCLYLLSFVITFARWPAWCQTGAVLAMPFLALPVVFVAESGMRPGIIVGTVLHLVAFFAVAMMCHGELAKSRPAPARLTEFYLLISLGGVLGGLFNALAAPLIFSSVIEHEIALVLACLMLPSLRPAGPLYVERRFGWRPSRVRGSCLDAMVALLAGVVVLDLLVVAGNIQDSDTAANAPVKIAAFGAPLLACIAFRNRPLRFGLSVAAVIFACRVNGPLPEPGRAVSITVHRQRSFFSVLTVDVEAPNTVAESHVLTHGTTLHGQQFTDARLKQEPITYYSRSGPLGQVMQVAAASETPKSIALIGLGAGACACYARKGDALDCYEIDAAVARIAADPDYFTYLTDCQGRGCPVRLVLGDARLRLREAADHAYDVIILDAFSSDAVPIHLLTRQAVELYMNKLARDGYLLIHISNRFLDLEPVVGNIAHVMHLTAYVQCDDVIDLPGKWGSDWVVVLKDPERGQPLLARAHAAPRSPGSVRFDSAGLIPGRFVSPEKAREGPPWKPAATDGRVGVWTDDYSNLLSVFRLR
jgi:spermidine synthase